MDNKINCCFVNNYGACYKQSYTQERNLIEDIDSNDHKLLEKRTNLKQEQITNLCTRHHDMLVVRYEGNQKSCCNPFLSHQKVCRASLRVITMHSVLEAETICLNLIPGKKLLTCRSKVMTCLSKSIRKALPDVTVQLVKTFYEDDEHSRIMPAKKDYSQKDDIKLLNISFS
nr:uncharacterized protein LOC124817220 [Hydra vulgaris]